jgi:hypothetical protein
MRESLRPASKLEKSLVAYAVAACAAGVSLLALSRPAGAEIITTRTNIVVPINGGLIQFDINGDGIPDFGLSATTFYDTLGGGHRPGRPPLGAIFGGRLQVVPGQTANQVAINNGGFAAALPPGIEIGPGRHFVENAAKMAGIVATGCGGSSLAYGNWKGSHPPHSYLAVKFNDASDSVHFGWVRISVTETAVDHFSATIDAYAYETVPNKPILSGASKGPASGANLVSPSITPKVQPSLGVLALGARGLAVWRKQDEEKTC